MSSPAIRLPIAIFDRFAAGESLAAIAEDFDLSIERCEENLRIQCKIVVMRRSDAKLRGLLAKAKTLEELCFAGSYAYHHNLNLPSDFLDKYNKLASEAAIDE